MLGILNMLNMPKIKKAPTQPAELPALLARCRAEKKLRLQDVAKKLGLGVATLSRFERGEGGVARTTLYRIEEFLREHGFLGKRTKAA
jgi:transcriptional regulator with XRE-family HTH domain